LLDRVKGAKPKYTKSVKLRGKRTKRDFTSNGAEGENVEETPLLVSLKRLKKMGHTGTEREYDLKDQSRTLQFWDKE